MLTSTMTSAPRHQTPCDKSPYLSDAIRIPSPDPTQNTSYKAPDTSHQLVSNTQNIQPQSLHIILTFFTVLETICSNLQSGTPKEGHSGAWNMLS